MRRISLSLGVWCILSSLAQAQTPPARLKPTSRDSAIDQQAMAVLNKMSGFLKTLKTFKIKSEGSTDEIVDTNMKVQKNASGEISIQLPARAYAHVRGDAKDFELFYDGQTVALHSNRHEFYATMPAPPTVNRTLDVIRASYGISFPLADFVDMASGENLLKGITAAGYIGTSWIDGVECDHVAVRQADVDWQVWIERSETPLPRKYVITSKKEPTQPQYIVKLNWDLSPKFSEDMFVFTPSANDKRIAFGRVNGGTQKAPNRQTPPKQK